MRCVQGKTTDNEERERERERETVLQCNIANDDQQHAPYGRFFVHVSDVIRFVHGICHVHSKDSLGNVANINTHIGPVASNIGGVSNNKCVSVGAEQDMGRSIVPDPHGCALFVR